MSLKSAIKTNPVLLATKSWCSYCQAALSNIEGQGVKPKVLELDSMENGPQIHEELKTLTSQRTVPYIFINGQFVGGYSDFMQTRYCKDLAEFLKMSKL